MWHKCSWDEQACYRCGCYRKQCPVWGMWLVCPTPWLSLGWTLQKAMPRVGSVAERPLQPQPQVILHTQTFPPMTNPCCVLPWSWLLAKIFRGNDWHRCDENVDTGNDALRSLQNLPPSPSQVYFTVCLPMHFSLEKRVQIPLQIQTEKRNWCVLKETFIRNPDSSSKWCWRIWDKFKNSQSAVRTKKYIKAFH